MEGGRGRESGDGGRGVGWERKRQRNGDRGKEEAQEGEGGVNS